jgi:hypothetical protein
LFLAFTLDANRVNGARAAARLIQHGDVIRAAAVPAKIPHVDYKAVDRSWGQ